MKQFACGSVVPGCQAVFVAEEEEEILAQVTAHARSAHAVSEPSPELLATVREHIVAVGG